VKTNEAIYVRLRKVSDRIDMVEVRWD